MLSRREFTRSMLIVPFAIATGLEGVLAQPSKLIFFEEALHNINLREGYIIQTLRQLFGEELVKKYLQNVYYVHDLSKAKNFSRKDIEELVNAGAVVPTIPERFGRNLRHDLYVFRKTFENYRIKVGDKEIAIVPTEMRFKSELAHEFVHVEDVFKGIVLENGYQINGTNYAKLNEPVKHFVIETRGYIKGIEVSRALEQPNLIYLFKGEVRKLPPAYLSSISSFSLFLQKLEKEIRTETLGMGDFEYIRNQMMQIRVRVPETGVLPVVKRLYIQFRIR